MKRSLITIACMLLGVTAFAQFNDTSYSGLLERHNGGMRLDGTDLTPDEMAIILADVNGVDRTLDWESYKRKRALGEGLIIGGSSAAAAGAVVFVGTTVVWVLVAALGGGIAAVASGGDTDSTQNAVDDLSKQFAPWFWGSGILTGAGAVAAVSGIPILVVNNKKLNGIVNEWNQAQGNVVASDISLNFGAAPSGIGLTLNF
ncbi:MAG: hypothetical protein J6X25_01865 [Bacteroidales bacterium]|nr:hypothetical protein [Bacteroidales bacterium]